MPPLVHSYWLPISSALRKHQALSYFQRATPTPYRIADRRHLSAIPFCGLSPMRYPIGFMHTRLHRIADTGPVLLPTNKIADSTYMKTLIVLVKNIHAILFTICTEYKLVAHFNKIFGFLKNFKRPAGVVLIRPIQPYHFKGTVSQELR